MDKQTKYTYLLKGDIMEYTDEDIKVLKAIRKDMWIIYNREKSINGVTELINAYSEALLNQLAINAGHIKYLNEISKKLDDMGIQEPNDGKGKTG